MIRRKHTLTALAAAGLLTASLGLGHLPTTHAQDTPPATTTGGQVPPSPENAGPRSGPKEGPGPGGEHPPLPPRPDDAPILAKPVDPNAAPVAVKTATDALAGLSVGQVWTRTMPRGEQQVQGSLLFQGREVARLEFDPVTGTLLARGQHTPPPLAPGGPRGERGPSAGPKPPVPADAPDAPKADAPKPDGAAAPGPDAKAPAPVGAPAADAPASDASAKSVTSVKLDQVKGQLPDILKGLSIAQGAEVMPREGYWKVALISGSRVVGELRLSGDGKTVIQDFGATRDAAMFAR